jgi:hypothetical protein
MIDGHNFCFIDSLVIYMKYVQYVITSAIILDSEIYKNLQLGYNILDSEISQPTCMLKRGSLQLSLGPLRP